MFLQDVAQQAWIFNDTVKGNILFGLEEEPERYQKTVHSCSLMSDLEQFPVSVDRDKPYVSTLTTI